MRKETAIIFYFALLYTAICDCADRHAVYNMKELVKELSCLSIASHSTQHLADAI